MRVTSGRYKGRNIRAPKDLSARPTTDFAKQALFNILQHSVPMEGIRVLDLFAGTGAISLEFLSRGAIEVISVDHDEKAFRHLQRSARDTGIDTWRLVRADALTYLRNAPGPFDIVFADPPFTMEGVEHIPMLVQISGALAPDGLFVLEHSRDVKTGPLPGFVKHRDYGTVHFSFFKPTTDKT
ncbi:MAG: RsmD family RNA methyltransferase [Flavobacteriales bacterium]